MPDEIQPGTTIFIDANIFLYKILDSRKYAEPCSNLLKEDDADLIKLGIGGVVDIA